MAGKAPRAPRCATVRRRLTPPALAALASALGCAPAAAASEPAASTGSPEVVVSNDSVLVSGLPSFGTATVTATRPDAVTGAPVAIGTYSGSATPFTPLSVDTTTPTPLAPSGDCWQQGALPRALTPDLQPGDTVTVTQSPQFGLGGGTSPSTSVVVQGGDLTGHDAGPIAGCSSLAPWAENAITQAPTTVGADTALTVSGVAQPEATAVSVTVSDGTRTTAPATVTPSASGTWTATVSAPQLQPLTAGALTVTPVFGVPDVLTGKPAHIDGVGAQVTKTAAGSGTASATPGSSGAPAPRPSSPAAAPARPTAPSHSPAGRSATTRISGLRLPTRLSRAAVARRGIRPSFVAPSDGRVVQLSLLQGRRTLYVHVQNSRRRGTRQTLSIPARVAGRLGAGTYTISIRTGRTRSTLGPVVRRTMLIT